MASVRGTLLAELRGPGSVVLDLTGLTSLSSSGLGLLLEAVRARVGEPAAEVLLPGRGPVRRLLDLTGLAGAHDG